MNISGMHIPKYKDGSKRYTMAQLTNLNADVNVLCMPIDHFNFNMPIKFVKIDVEGHELFVLMGMEMLLKKDHPLLLLEGGGQEIENYLSGRKSIDDLMREEFGEPDFICPDIAK